MLTVPQIDPKKLLWVLGLGAVVYLVLSRIGTLENVSPLETISQNLEIIVAILGGISILGGVSLNRYLFISSNSRRRQHLVRVQEMLGIQRSLDLALYLDR